MPRKVMRRSCDMTGFSYTSASIILAAREGGPQPRTKMPANTTEARQKEADADKKPS
jgi:hypothetical protein